MFGWIGEQSGRGSSDLHVLCQGTKHAANRITLRWETRRKALAPTHVVGPSTKMLGSTSCLDACTYFPRTCKPLAIFREANVYCGGLLMVRQRGLLKVMLASPGSSKSPPGEHTPPCPHQPLAGPHCLRENLAKGAPPSLDYRREQEPP